MAEKKVPFYVFNRTTLTSATQRIELLTVPPGYLYCIQRMSCRNNTTATFRTNYLLVNGGVDMPLSYAVQTVAGWCMDKVGDYYITENQAIVAVMVTATIGDVIEIYLSGWKARVSEMAIPAE